MKIFNTYGFTGAVAVLLTVAACSDKFEDVAAAGGGQTAAKTYSVSVGADSGSEATRAGYDGVVYKWSPGDRVGFYMVPAGGGTPIVSNARFTGTNAVASVTADFEGDLSESSLSEVSPSAAYDYYSYFPYNAGAGSAGFPNVAFNIPNTITLTPDVFPAEYGFMIGKQTSSADEKPISWLEGGQQKLGKRIGFSYKHVFAYLQVYLKLNLMTQDINRIVVTCTDGSAMSGTAHVNLETGAMNFVASSGSITININGGLNVDEDPDKGYIWIPVNPALAGKTFKLEFYTTGGNMIDQTVTGGQLQAGMKHKAGFRLPFKISFEDFSALKDQGLEGISQTEFIYKGYKWGGNGKQICRDNHMEFPAYGGNLFGGGDISKDNDKRAMLRLPAMNLKNKDGKSAIPVQIRICGNGGSILEGTLSTHRRMYYAAVSETHTTHLNNNYPYFLAEYSIGLWDWLYTDTGASRVTLTESNPCVALHYIGNYAPSSGLKNVARVKEIWLIP